MSTATKKAKKISLANNTIIFSFISILLGLLVGVIMLPVIKLHKPSCVANFKDEFNIKDNVFT